MHNELIQKNPVLKHSFELALMVIDYCELLQEQKRFVIANQLMKSGTSIGANIMEAQNPESKADFVHKMKIAAKEAEETQYWLMLCKYSTKYPSCDELLTKLDEINRLLGKILSTAKRKNPFGSL
jgi:four helix bundle protein